MKNITLTTDFGLHDGYTGIMRGVIYQILSDVHITDLSHSIRPQNVMQACLVWRRSYRFFPAGTVHVAVIDPGVGTQRRAMAARIGDFFFVCPDNGLITPILEEAHQAGETVEMVHLDQSRYWLPEVSNVFHGRDIFAPAAAHLAAGVSLAEMGSPLHDPLMLRLPQAQPMPNGWRGEIIDIDSFGNLVSVFRADQVQGRQNVRVRLANAEVNGLSRTYGEHAAGELMALMDSEGYLSIAEVNGSAAVRLHTHIGDWIEILFP